MDKTAIQTRKRKLTAKQVKWTEVFAQTLNATEAARQAYLPDNPEITEGSLRVIGSTNLTKFNIQEALENLRSTMVSDSYPLYATQKQILNKTLEDDNLELANKIINKVIDRAGLMPVYKQESKHITARFTFRRGSTTPPQSPVLEANSPDTNEIN